MVCAAALIKLTHSQVAVCDIPPYGWLLVCCKMSACNECIANTQIMAYKSWCSRRVGVDLKHTSLVTATIMPTGIWQPCLTMHGRQMNVFKHSRKSVAPTVCNLQHNHRAAPTMARRATHKHCNPTTNRMPTASITHTGKGDNDNQS